jgi:hypothetical protein
LAAWAACFAEAQREREQAAVEACCHYPDAGREVEPNVEPNVEREAPIVEACCLDSGFGRNSKPLSSR